MLHLYYTSIKDTKKENRKVDSFMEAKFDFVIFLYSSLSGYRKKSAFGCFFPWQYKVTRTCTPQQDADTKHRSPRLLLDFTEEIKLRFRGGGLELKSHNELVTEPSLEFRSHLPPPPLSDKHVQKRLDMSGWPAGQGGRYQVSGQGNS